MKMRIFVIAMALGWAIQSAWAGGTVYRCGNVYSDVPAAGCQAVTSGNVTVVKGLPPSQTQGAATAAVRDMQTQQREQTQAELQIRLQQLQARRTELLSEYQGGTPEITGPEHRNHQKYLDRVSALKDEIDSNAQEIDRVQQGLQ
jgi:hypothetical protein